MQKKETGPFSCIKHKNKFKRKLRALPVEIQVDVVEENMRLPKNLQ